MAEIKTCEQYVLAKMAELEQENHTICENLQNVVTQYNNLMTNVHTLKNILSENMRVREVPESPFGEGRYITCWDINEWINKEAFDFMVNFLKLEEDIKDASISDQIQTEDME